MNDAEQVSKLAGAAVGLLRERIEALEKLTARQDLALIRIVQYGQFKNNELDEIINILTGEKRRCIT